MPDQRLVAPLVDLPALLLLPVLLLLLLALAQPATLIA
jgi:hypothetical protein